MFNLAINKKYISTIIMTLVFKCLLEFGYFEFVNPSFEYMGFIIDISWTKLFESYLIVILILIFLAKLDYYEKPSKIVIYILFLNLYLPMSSLYWIQDQPREYFLVISVSFLILYFIICKSKPISIPNLKEGSHLAFLILLGITVIVYGFLIATGGLQRMNLNLLNVYSTRQGYVSSSNTLVAYLLPWQAHVVNLTFLTTSLIKNKKFFIMLTLFIQVLLFSMTNFKSFLFAPLVVLGLYFIFKQGFKNSLLMLMSFLLSILMSILLILYKINGDIVLLSIFLRRLFFAPADLNFVYYHYFSQVEKYKLSHSILSGITDNPYSVSPVVMVAKNVYGEDFSPNVGVFGDAYLNFGLIGIVVFVIILAFVLVLFDSVARPAPFILPVTIIAIPSMSLVNSAMFTCFATHGILFAIFVTWLSSGLFKKNERITL
ncbi:oligosaccharide repeat unit polymerase [Metabacillus halosaccharovorans]|uniref:oligosaccharide repeat unit polymerase n=1 Tax=Metabacillus halosaccharovorans TaxID=930124 RepID=UPI001FEAE219|nr:oligosaccharide repeat unit polymerase [Metabacillus halosaccharovorans]